MDYEKPIGSGKLRYDCEGKPAGIVESWRFTRALEDYFFLRIDLDARNSPEPMSYLYHLLLNPTMGVERLKFRYFGSSTEVQGDVQFDENIITSNRLFLDRKNKTSGRSVEEIYYDPEARFWLPTVIGAGLFASYASDSQELLFVTLLEDSEFALSKGSAEISWGSKENLVVSRRDVTVRPCSIDWDNKYTQVWLDKHNWPVKARIFSGCSARESAYIRYETNVI
jgi:hypothetical protein